MQDFPSSTSSNNVSLPPRECKEGSNVTQAAVAAQFLWGCPVSYNSVLYKTRLKALELGDLDSNSSAKLLAM